MLKNWKPEGYTVKELSEVLNKMVKDGYSDFKIHISGDYIENGFYHGNVSDLYTDIPSAEIILESEANY